MGDTGGRVVPPERRYDQLLHAVVERIERHGYTAVARRSTVATSCVLLHAPGTGSGHPGRFLVVVHLPAARCLRVHLYTSWAALRSGAPERRIDRYYQATRPKDLRRIAREVVATIPPPV